MIREIQTRDNKAIAQVIRKALEEYGQAKEGTVYTDPTTDDLFALFRTEGSVYFILELEGEVVGGCGIYPTKGLPSGYAELVKLYLDSNLRGKGYGKELMQKSMEAAQKMGYTHLYLESIPALNEAVHLYEKVGFKKLNAPLGDSGHFSCDLWMEKELGLE